MWTRSRTSHTGQLLEGWGRGYREVAQRSTVRSHSDHRVSFDHVCRTFLTGRCVVPTDCRSLGLSGQPSGLTCGMKWRVGSVGHGGRGRRLRALCSRCPVAFLRRYCRVHTACHSSSWPSRGSCVCASRDCSKQGEARLAGEQLFLGRQFGQQACHAVPHRTRIRQRLRNALRQPQAAHIYVAVGCSGTQSSPLSEEHLIAHQCTISCRIGVGVVVPHTIFGRIGLRVDTVWYGIRPTSGSCRLFPRTLR